MSGPPSIQDRLPGELSPWLSPWRLALLAGGLTLVCLYPVLANGWVNWDDQAYVLRNPLVRNLNWDNLTAMFTTPEQVGLYHPVTLLSLAVDRHFWELDAFGFHLSSLLLHLVNVGLVFALAHKLTRRRSAAFLVALLFGIHPMHVESVAWISARKDLLYTLFGLLSLLAWLSFLRENGSRRHWWYGLSLLCLLLALLSKAAAFTLPFLFFLVDYLDRRTWSWKLVGEKVPFLVLALGAIAWAQVGQSASGSMVDASSWTVWESIAIGMRNLVYYLVQAVVPVQLSPFHPFPSGTEAAAIPNGWYYLSIFLVLLGGLALYRVRWSHRKLVFGLLFFGLTIGLHLQMIPYGKALVAERYTYLPYVGLFLLLGWAVERVYLDREGGWDRWRIPLMALMGGWLLFLGGQSWSQARVWRDGESLWTAVVNRYPDNAFGYLSRARARIEVGQWETALADLDRAAQLDPDWGAIFYERGLVLEKSGKIDLALQDYDAALKRDSTLGRAYLNRALIRARQGAPAEEVLKDLDAAIVAKPGYALAHLNRGLILRGMNREVEALAAYGEAIRLEPWNPILYRYRGSYAEALENWDQAERDFRKAIEVEPQSGENHFLLSRMFLKKGNVDPARQEAVAAMELGFELDQEFRNRLGL